MINSAFLLIFSGLQTSAIPVEPLQVDYRNRDVVSFRTETLAYLDQSYLNPSSVQSFFDENFPGETFSSFVTPGGNIGYRSRDFIFTHSPDGTKFQLIREGITPTLSFDKAKNSDELLEITDSSLTRMGFNKSDLGIGSPRFYWRTGVCAHHYS